MKKIISLIKASFTSNMNLFRIKNKNHNKLLPFILGLFLLFIVYNYANMIMVELKKINLEIGLLTLFILISFITTLVEGIYKTSNLLYNQKDDDLLFSLPLKRSSIIFLRIFKFYVFEVMFNSIILLPAMVVYAINVDVSISFYFISFLALFLLPISAIIISCIIGSIISFISVKFRLKGLVQVFITTIFLLITLYLSYNMEYFIENISGYATSISDFVIRIFYPAGIYIRLIEEFNFVNLLLFVGIHLFISIVTIFILSRNYFKINSRSKIVRESSNKKYVIKYYRPLISLIRKELKKIISTPVLIINACFGLILYIIASLMFSLKYDSIINGILSIDDSFNIDIINSYLPIIVLGLIIFVSLTTSITSSLISLEGRRFNILKSMPISYGKIIISKVVAALVIMIPIILLGDIIIFIRFNFKIFDILLLIIISFVLPIVSELMGIIVNIMFPKMNAENDTEVVKQSTSSMVSVFCGMILIGLSLFCLIKMMLDGISSFIIIIIILSFYIILGILLIIYINKRSIKDLEKISV